jgi:hypothetical protein
MTDHYQLYHRQHLWYNLTIHHEYQMMAWHWHSLGTCTQNKMTASVHQLLDDEQHFGTAHEIVLYN